MTNENDDSNSSNAVSSSLPCEQEQGHEAHDNNNNNNNSSTSIVAVEATTPSVPQENVQMPQTEDNNSMDRLAPNTNDNERDGSNENDKKKNKNNMWFYYYIIPAVLVLVSVMFRKKPSPSHDNTNSSRSSIVWMMILADWIVWPIYQLMLTVVGMTVGVALGLGFAAHVYDQLTEWHERHQQQLMQQQQVTMTQATTTDALGSSTNMMLHTSSTPSFRRAASTGTAAAVTAAAVLQHADDYTSLMVSAGYPPAKAATTSTSTADTAAKLVRGLVVRSFTPWLYQPNYNFTGQPQNSLSSSSSPPPQHAMRLLQELWPALPSPIHQKLGYFVELILRDFVACWYSSIDEGCEYRDAAKQVKLEQEEKEPPKQASQTTTASQQQQHARVMLYSLAPHRSSPFLDALYESVVIMFGNLATRVEHVNVLAVVLLQWTRVLAHTFKVYRALRKSVLQKQRFLQTQQPGVRNGTNTRRGARGEEPVSSVTASNLRRRRSSRTESTKSRNGGNNDVDHNDDFPTATATRPVSEIAMTKEFLFAGKLHRAITFGLDVPGLLFADASGRECGAPDPLPHSVEDYDTTTTTTDNNNNDTKVTPEDIVLAKRLFETPLLRECELDYNRVVAHRMVRALVTRQDYGSPIVASLLTEVMAGCVLTPMMSVFTPEYLNSWVIKGLSTSSSEEGGDGEEEKKETVVEKASAETTLETSTAPTDPLLGPLNPTASGAADLSSPVNIKKTKDSNDLYPESPEQRALEDLSENAALILSSSSAEQRRNSSDMNTPASPTAEDNIISLLALAVIDLSKHVDFEEYRTARENNQDMVVDWDDPACRAAVLRLVLVIELALTHGRCTYKSGNLAPTTTSVASPMSLEEQDEEDEFDEIDESEQELEVTLSDYESTTLSQLLMEATSDPANFEERVATENTLAAEINANKYEDMEWEEYKPTATEQSTVRTLIAAWLHTGQIFRMVSVLSQAHATVLAPYFHESAFLRSRTCANGFVRQLKALEGVEILVDTMTVLACPRLDETDNDSLRELIKKATAASPTSRSVPREDGMAADDFANATSISAAQLMSSSATPRFLDFHRNESFASSLRSERERRMQSWMSIVAQDDGEAFVPVSRTKGVSQECTALHRELHHISRIFYTGTNIIGIRDAARRKNSGQTEGASLAEASVASDEVHLSLLTVETACPRRRIEVPDDDSSFLLRAQPRSLNAVGVHRDQRNYDQSFKCFAATYEEPVPKAGTEHYAGGRFVRRCLIRYYPIDRTASVALQSDSRKLDQRKTSFGVPGTITVDHSSRPAPFLSADFLRERHLCQRWVPKGTARSQSLLASSVVEPTDFTATPRSGKAIDYIYKMAFFEKPMIDLGGKHFAVHDSASLGVHRADASSMELSDASLSFALLTLGATEDKSDTSSKQQGVQMGKDGYPVIWMKFSRKQDDAQVEVKPYRTSFVRAALMVTAARQEAQLQCLIKCVRAGSAKKATKPLTDSQLKPTQKLVEYAGSASREKQSMLLRDLKLGVNHIDRAQLRRNGLLSPRYPTELLDFSAFVEDAVQITEGDFFGATTTAYKIRCAAKVRLIVERSELDGFPGYLRADGNAAETFREEWVVYRSFKEFQTFHKHLKGQVSMNMSSGTAGSRLVGAATAAFASTASQHGGHHRRALIPSLSQASKAGALGVTKKSILRRKEILNGYIGYLLSPGNPMNRNSELLLFLAAFYPLPPEARIGQTVSVKGDPLGRHEVSRIVVQEHTVRPDSIVLDVANDTEGSKTRAKAEDGRDEESVEDEEENYARKTKKSDMIPSIQAKVEKVPLAQVRNRFFELLRYQFGFENASFIRNRMLAALKTASFAVTTPSEFRKTLYKLHVEHLSASSIAYWIQYGCDLLWPNGVFFESAPPSTREELNAQAAEAKQILHKSFPEQVRAILGQELTRDGLNIFHEMLQNRVVMKSMAYMLFDLLWLEVFPEIGDVLQCGAALDIDQ